MTSNRGGGEAERKAATPCSPWVGLSSGDVSLQFGSFGGTCKRKDLLKLTDSFLSTNAKGWGVNSRKAGRERPVTVTDAVPAPCRVGVRTCVEVCQQTAGLWTV